MCEFKVFLDGEKVMEDVIFAQAEGLMVTLRDVIGETKELDGVTIAEVNVPATRLLLKRS